jgi:putative phosphoribosyl transferase
MTPVPRTETTNTNTTTTAVRVPSGGAWLLGDLGMPPHARGLVLFAHGSGSSRHSRRNQAVARAFERRGLATMLIDLLTPEEERIDRVTALYRFDVERLARRLVSIITWLTATDGLATKLPIGLFGASTGAGAALIAAALRPQDVAAVVSRGGRPDLAGHDLLHVRAPTLLIVGGRDMPVIHLNRRAMALMPGEVRLEIVPGATHLFEEPDALDVVAELATGWFLTHLKMPATPHGTRFVA